MSPFRQAAEWVLWDARRAALTAAGVLVAFMAAILTFGGAEPTATAASPTSSARPTPTDGFVVPIPSVSTAPLPSAPSSTVPLVTPTYPGSGRDNPATPEGAADKFMRAWLEVHDLDRDEWTAQLEPMATKEMREVIAVIPASLIPAARVVSSIEKSNDGTSATVAVGITNGSTYTVTLRRDAEGIWKVASADNYGGDSE